MTGLWIITGCVIALTLALTVAALWFIGKGYRYSAWAWITGIGAMVGGTVAFVFVLMTISAYVDRSGCSTWQDQTGRESKFVFYTPVTWDCLAKTQDGTWLPKEQLREFGEDAG